MQAAGGASACGRPADTRRRPCRRPSLGLRPPPSAGLQPHSLYDSLSVRCPLAPSGRLDSKLRVEQAAEAQTAAQDGLRLFLHGCGCAVAARARATGRRLVLVCGGDRVPAPRWSAAPRTSQMQLAPLSWWALVQASAGGDIHGLGAVR